MGNEIVIPAGFKQWVICDYHAALSDNSIGNVTGAVYAGLGLGYSASEFALTHLNTGHMVLVFKCGITKAFVLATELANKFDWDFTSLYGWKNNNPDLISQLSMWCELNVDHVQLRGGPPNERLARDIVAKRAI